VNFEVLLLKLREITVGKDRPKPLTAKGRSMTGLLCFQFNHYPLLQIIFSILYSFIQFEINVIYQSVVRAAQ
jgi:hypothetical protein